MLAAFDAHFTALAHRLLAVRRPLRLGLALVSVPVLQLLVSGLFLQFGETLVPLLLKSGLLLAFLYATSPYLVLLIGFPAAGLGLAFINIHWIHKVGFKPEKALEGAKFTIVNWGFCAAASTTIGLWVFLTH